MLRFILLCFFPAWQLVAMSFDASFFAITRNDPSALIDGCVSAITGDFILSDEVIEVKGAEPISFTMHYLSTKSDQGGVFHGWFADSHLLAEAKWTLPSNASSHKTHEYDIAVTVIEDDYIPLLYRRQGAQTNTSTGLSTLRLEVDEKDFLENLQENTYTNVQAHYAMRRQYIDMDYKGKSFVVFSPSGRKRQYKRIVHPEHSRGKKDTFTYRLEKETLPNGNQIIYTYESLQSRHLTSIKTQNASGTSTFAWIRFHFWGREKDLLQAETSDGQLITYVFREDDETRKNLYTVMSTKHPEKHFTYHPGTSLIKDYKLPEDKTKRVRYYRSRDRRNKKVRSLSHIGEDGHFVKKYCFNYFPGKYRQNGGYTEVFDAEGNKTVYRYNALFRLERVEYYYKEANRQILSHQDVFAWGEEKHLSWQNVSSSSYRHNPSNPDLLQDRLCYLLAKSRLDASGKCYSSERYFYDAFGNVSELRVYGDITGKSNPITLHNFLPDRSAAEYRSTKRVYSTDGKNLLLSEKKGALHTKFFYDKKTNLLLAKLTTGENVSLRTFYQYDQNAQLICTIEDDGVDRDERDLTGVSHRSIQRVKRRQDAFLSGMPDFITTAYLDMDRQVEVPLKSTQLHYDLHGNIVKEEVCDAKGVCQYENRLQYDKKNRPIRKANALYTEFISYDANNRICNIEALDSKKAERFTYNPEGHLVLKEDISDGEEIRATKIRYDALGRILSQENHLGKVDEYKYDKKGHIITTTSKNPSLEGGYTKDKKVQHFDCLGRMIKETSTIGGREITYNIDGKPVYIKYPDGTKEHFTYDLRGLLQTHVNQRNTTRIYTYDCLGRKTAERVYSPSQKLLDQRTWRYNALHLVEESLSDGTSVYYTYNFAGQLVEKTRLNQPERYTYDTLGRLSSIVYRKDQVTFRKRFEYDLLDRVIEKRIEEDSPRRRVLFRESYSYDMQNHLVKKTQFIQNRPATKLWEYDAFSRPLSCIDEEGHLTSYSYKVKEVAKGVFVDEERIEGPSGDVTIQWRDANSHLVKTEKISNGKTLEEDRYAYDASGNLIFHEETLFFPGLSPKKASKRYTYDSMQRIASISEFADSVKERTFYYTYSPTGRLQETIKPDRVSVRNEYDFLDRLRKIHSSDGTISYLYQYDLAGNMICCKDLLTGQKTKRRYDAWGSLIYDQLEHGFSIEYAYDHLGNRTKMQLADDSYVTYSYDPLYLDTICRYDAYGKEIFAHTCLQYDLAGNTLREQSGFLTEKVYGKTGGVVENRQAHLHQKVLSTHPKGNIEQLQSEISGEQVLEEFFYDSFGYPTEEKGSLSKTYDYWIREPFSDQQAERKGLVTELGRGTRCKRTYDQNGSLQSERFSNKTALYDYDALGRLIVYSIPGAFKIRYDYDGLHRRIAKTVYLAKGKAWEKKYSSEFIYDGDVEVGKCQYGSLIEFRTLKPVEKGKMPSILFLEVNEEGYFPLQDVFGNTVCLLDQTMRVVESVSFTLFGEDRKEQPGPSINPWRFAGVRKDAESDKLYRKRRYYSPQYGIWLTKDPNRFYHNPQAQVDDAFL